MSVYPLVFEPIYKEKVWGGRALERLGRALPGGRDAKVGESWEIADLARTSVTGGGGGAEYSVVRKGPWEGRTLRELLSEDATSILGPSLARSEEFPLLVKYLDARENLSVQVHPSAGYAAEHPDAHLKSEAWYVVHADPGAVIYKGIQEGVSRADFAAAISAGTAAELLIAVPAEPGSCHYLPSGTCHALGGGVLVAEVQTPSDTTFRVFDWGRTDRELHVEQALECIDFGPLNASRYEPGTRSEVDGVAWKNLVRCEHFTIDEARVAEDASILSPLDRMSIWMVLEGGLHIDGFGLGDHLFAGAGDTVLLPAGLDGAQGRASSDALVLDIGCG